MEADQVMHAQSPLKTYRHYHECFTLFVGQGDLHAIAKEIGFDNICTIDQIKEAYPLLDVVDHKNRKVIVSWQKYLCGNNACPKKKMKSI